MSELKDWRISKSLTQAEAGDLLKASQAAISLWERGSRPIPAKKLREVHQLTLIPLEKLLSIGQPDKSPDSNSAFN